MPGHAGKATVYRDLHDADFHAREAAAAMKRARERAPVDSYTGVLETLEQDQRNARGVLKRLGEHLRQRRVA